MSELPKCKVGGMVAPGAACPHVIVGGKACGFAGGCEHQDPAREQTAPADRAPDAWIIESKAGIWLTQKPEVAEKNRAKAGTLVVPYFSRKATP